MADVIVIRPATMEEIETLSAICMRSKAHWGYDEAFMQSSRDALSVKPERIEAGDVLVAELDGTPAGVAAIAPDEDGFEIDLFFVDPPAMGHGTGVRLFQALTAHARARGIASLTILSDPNAASFYERMGARRIGSAPSDAIPGRTLPLYEIDTGG
ncbi:MAG: GNAT family N-acetyltransferase [Hyphomicrobiales bacterium]|nr:GNAT family N-acetyltransferase [Hyphomicrobiales bacterium]MCP5001769.1 GNAT family N-acetyltransferase [Hyphomicrobiales bacterium]